MNAHSEFNPDATIKTLTVDLRELRTALLWVNTVRQARNTIPILGHNRFRVEGGKLTITATDLVREASETIPCTSAEDWSFVANGYRIAKVTAGITGSVTIQHNTSEDRLTLTADGITLVMNIMSPPEDWPSPEQSKELGEVEIGEANLLQSLKLVKQCISTEETRYYLNGIFWTTNGITSRFVTTDGHRLARLDLDVPSPPFDAIYPRDAIAPLSAMLTPKGNRSANVKFSGRDETVQIIAVQIGERTLSSKVIEGTYPDYERVVPSPERPDKIDIVVPRTAAKRLKLMAESDRHGSRACCISPEKGTMSIGTSDRDATLSIAYAPAGKDAPDIGFDINYLSEATDTLGDLRLRTLSPGDPATLTSEAHTNLLVVLMPMRT